MGSYSVAEYLVMDHLFPIVRDVGDVGAHGGPPLQSLPRSGYGVIEHLFVDSVFRPVSNLETEDYGGFNPKGHPAFIIGV